MSNTKEQITKQKIELEKLKIKPKYKDMIPRPCSDDYGAMLDDIEKNGIREPIVVNNGFYILDGHTRYDIAKELGTKEVEYIIRDFKDEDAEIKYMYSINLLRRHLNTAQRVEMCCVLVKIEAEKQDRLKKEAEKRNKGKKDEDKEKLKFKTPRDVVADEHHVSNKTLQSAIFIKDVVKKSTGKESKELGNSWERAQLGEKSVASVLAQAKLVNGKPAKKVDSSKAYVKKVYNMSTKLSELEANEINKIEDKAKEDIVQTLSVMGDFIDKLLEKISSNEKKFIDIPDNADAVSMTKSIQEMGNKKTKKAKKSKK